MRKSPKRGYHSSHGSDQHPRNQPPPPAQNRADPPPSRTPPLPHRLPLHHLPLPLDGNGAPAGEGVPLGLQDVGYLLGYLNNTTWVTCCPYTGSSLRPFQLKKCIISYSAKALGDIIMYYFLEFLADLLSPHSSDLGEGQVCSMLNIKNAMFCFLKSCRNLKVGLSLSYTK